jgi:site-specific recombinase XerD
MSGTTQSQFQSRLKAFFSWTLKLGLIQLDPSAAMRGIKPDGRQTIPLTASQFAELLAATDAYGDDPHRDTPHKGHELKILFLLMRWSGLRIGDCMIMTRSSLQVAPSSFLWPGPERE